MKKLITLALALTLTLALSACGGSSAPSSSGGNTAPATTPAEPKPEAAAPSGQALDSLIKWMQNGTFSYDFVMTSEGGGEKTESSGSMAMEGNNIAITTTMKVEGQTVNSRVIIKDNVTYIVDDVNKFIMKMPGGGLDITGGLITDYSDIALINSGTGEINGKTLPYEEYESAGATIKYYLDGGQVYGFESESEGYKTVMIITNPSNKAPADAFELPGGYTEM
jgi:outer membrane lipoprotein-sorting protein